MPMISYSRKKINFADAWWKVDPNKLAALILILFASTPNSSFGAEACVSKLNYTACANIEKSKCKDKSDYYDCLAKNVCANCSKSSFHINNMGKVKAVSSYNLACKRSGQKDFFHCKKKEIEDCLFRDGKPPSLEDCSEYWKD